MTAGDLDIAPEPRIDDTNLPEPPVPADADLRDYPRVAINHANLLGSAFNAHANGEEWRAGIILRLASWTQLPAGSLPDDDVQLRMLAGLGRDEETWAKINERALAGWYVSNDGRLYNKEVAEDVNWAWQSKVLNKKRTRKATANRWRKVRGHRRNGSEVSTAKAAAKVSQNKDAKASSATVSVTDVYKVNEVNRERSDQENQPYPEKPEPSVSRARAGELPKEGLFKNGRDALGRFAPSGARPPVVPSHVNDPVAWSRKRNDRSRERLRQILQTYVTERVSPRKRGAYSAGLNGADPEHDEQWWLDKIDHEARASGWMTHFKARFQ